jgi:hypothetical protein
VTADKPGHFRALLLFFFLHSRTILFRFRVFLKAFCCSFRLASFCLHSILHPFKNRGVSFVALTQLQRLESAGTGEMGQDPCDARSAIRTVAAAGWVVPVERVVDAFESK